MKACASDAMEVAYIRADVVSTAVELAAGTSIMGVESTGKACGFYFIKNA